MVPSGELICRVPTQVKKLTMLKLENFIKGPLTTLLGFVVMVAGGVGWWTEYLDNQEGAVVALVGFSMCFMRGKIEEAMQNLFTVAIEKFKNWVGGSGPKAGVFILFMLATQIANAQGFATYKFITLFNNTDSTSAAVTRDGTIRYDPVDDKFRVRVNGAWETMAVGATGITNTAAANELAKSNGTNLVPSGFFSSTAGNILLGNSASTTGTARTITSEGTEANIDLSLFPKGSGIVRMISNITFSSSTLSFGGNYTLSNSGTLLLTAAGITLAPVSRSTANPGYDLTMRAGTVTGSGTAGGNVSITGGQSSNANPAGHVFIDGGPNVSSGLEGNIGLFTSTGSFGSGEKVLFVNNATTAPSSNPTDGVIMYVVSGSMFTRNSSGVITNLSSIVTSNSASTAAGTVTLDMGSEVQRMFVGSASFATSKTMDLSNETNALVFNFHFEVTDVAATLVMPADWMMADSNFNTGTQTWTPPSTGLYELGGTWDGTNWKIKIAGPFL
jgi:hypothetical protein